MNALTKAVPHQGKQLQKLSNEIEKISLIQVSPDVRHYHGWEPGTMMSREPDRDSYTVKLDYLKCPMHLLPSCNIRKIIRKP